MFESLTGRMTEAMKRIRGLHKISEANVAEALKDVRTALLSADVHFKVVREFVDKVTASCLGLEVTGQVTPGQQIIKIIHDELVALLGEGATHLADVKPLSVMMVGLHGAGKTTATAKLARYLKQQGYKPLVVACDVYRPAAIDQLETLATQNDIHVYAERDQPKVLKIAENAKNYAASEGCDAIIFDTAGRLQIDEDLIQEVKDLSRTMSPDETLLVADSALGQEAVSVAETFHGAVQLTGIVLTKLDGDARGGAALSMKAMTQVPIKFMGTGEKVADFDVFHPDRMAQRILGMGDVVSLVEKAQVALDKDETAAMEAKMRKGQFDLQDFLTQMQQIKKLGSLGSIAKMLPGMQGMSPSDADQSKMKRYEAIIQSMTPQERSNPRILSGTRRTRIAKGSGVEVRAVNDLLKNFQMMQKMMKSMKGAKGKKMMQKMAAMQGAKGGNPFGGMGF